MKKFQMKIEAIIGPLYLVASESGLHGVYWEQQNVSMEIEKGSAADLLLQKTADQLKEFLSGERKVFDLPLYAEGTPFQKKVWQALAQIPYGETRSYKDVAVSLKNAKASRAVGTANGNNPHSIIVPCHRVIASNGTLGGYAGGLSIKTTLLKIEGNQTKASKKKA